MDRHVTHVTPSHFSTGVYKHPVVYIGPHCNSPYACPWTHVCWSFLPEHNVTKLYRGTKKAFKLLDEGVTDIADINAAKAKGQ